MKGFLAQVQQNGVHVEVDRLGGFGATVDDGRNTAGATQAAARSGALVIALFAVISNCMVTPEYYVALKTPSRDQAGVKYLFDEERRDRFLVADAADRLGQQLWHRQLTDARQASASSTTEWCR